MGSENNAPGGRESITSRMSDRDFERYTQRPGSTTFESAEQMLEEGRLLLLSGYSPRRAHVPLCTLQAAVDAVLTQLSTSEVRARIEVLRACSVAVSSAIAAASETLDQVDPLVYLELLAVEVMFVDVADEMERRIGRSQ